MAKGSHCSSFDIEASFFPVFDLNSCKACKLEKIFQKDRVAWPAGGFYPRAPCPAWRFTWLVWFNPKW